MTTILLLKDLILKHQKVVLILLTLLFGYGVISYTISKIKENNRIKNELKAKDVVNKLILNNTDTTFKFYSIKQQHIDSIIVNNEKIDYVTLYRTNPDSIARQITSWKRRNNH